MLSQEDFKKIEETTKEFFEKIGIEGEIEIVRPKEKTVPIYIETDTPQVLIGQKGQTLTALQHLLKAILRKQISSEFYIDIDVNHYKEKKVKYLKELARSIANEVSLSKKEKALEPMPAYERRIIHMELAGRSDVTTESVGEEPERKVVIKPYF